MDDAALAALRVAASAAGDIGFATMTGALASAALLQDASSAWAGSRARRALGLCVLASVVTLVASVAWRWVQAMSMTELAPGAALLAVGGIVADTQFGCAWAIGALACVACSACAWLARRHRPARAPWVAAGLALAVVAGARASAGHAGANGLGGFTVVMAVHLLAIGMWAGAVLAAVLAVLRGRDGADGVDRMRYAQRLSTLATVALALVLATGALAAWHGLGGSLAPLAPRAGSTWGLALDAKLAGVALAIALGAFNRIAVLPGLAYASEGGAAWRRFTRVLRVEAVVMLAVLVAAALLGNGEPPAM
jgi:putative copper resistance protein D